MTRRDQGSSGERAGDGGEPSPALDDLREELRTLWEKERERLPEAVAHAERLAAASELDLVDRVELRLLFGQHVRTYGPAWGPNEDALTSLAGPDARPRLLRKPKGCFVSFLRRTADRTDEELLMDEDPPEAVFHRVEPADAALLLQIYRRSLADHDAGVRRKDAEEES